MAETTRFGLSEQVISQITNVLAKHPNIQRVILYGSRAKGNYRANSDIDLCLIGDRLTLSEQMHIETELDELLLPYKIDLSVYHQLDNSKLVEHINRIGVGLA